MQHISNLHTEKAQLKELYESQRRKFEETKARAALVDELEVKSTNLANSNKHLAL